MGGGGGEGRSFWFIAPMWQSLDSCGVQLQGPELESRLLTGVENRRIGGRCTGVGLTWILEVNSDIPLNQHFNRNRFSEIRGFARGDETDQTYFKDLWLEKPFFWGLINLPQYQHRLQYNDFQFSYYFIDSTRPPPCPLWIWTPLPSMSILWSVSNTSTSVAVAADATREGQG